MKNGTSSLLRNWIRRSSLYLLGFSLMLQPLRVLATQGYAVYDVTIVNFPTNCVSFNGPILHTESVTYSMDPRTFLPSTESHFTFGPMTQQSNTAAWVSMLRVGGVCCGVLNTTLLTETQRVTVVNSATQYLYFLVDWCGDLYIPNPKIWYVKHCLHNAGAYNKVVEYSRKGVVLQTSTTAPGSDSCVVLGPFVGNKPDDLVVTSLDGNPIYADLPDGVFLLDTDDVPDRGLGWYNPPKPDATVPGTNSVAVTGIPSLGSSTNGGGLTFTGTGTAGDAKDSTLRDGFTVLANDIVSGFNRENASDAVGNQQLANILAALGTANTSLSAIKLRDDNNGVGIASISNTVKSISTIAMSQSNLTFLIGQTLTNANVGISNVNNAVGTGGSNTVARLDTLNTNLNVRLNTLDTNLSAANALSITRNQTLANQTAILSNMYQHELTNAGGSGGIDLSGVNTRLDAVKTSVDTVATDVLVVNGSVNGVSNVLASFTNMLKELYGVDDSLDTEHTAGESQGNALSDSFTASQAGVSPASMPSGSADVFTFSVGAYTFNCDPGGNGIVGSVATAIKSLLAWVATLVYIFACWREGQTFYIASMQAQQARAAQISIFGNSVGPVTGIPIALAMTVAIAAVPALLNTFLQTAWPSLWGTHPLSFMASAGAAGAGAVYLTDLFIPVQVILVNLSLYCLFRLTISGVYAVAATICRFLVG